MGVVDLFPGPRLQVFVQLRILNNPPCHVWRRDGMTLLTCDPRFSRLEITAKNVEILTDEEASLMRAAYGLPPINERAPDWITEDAPAFLYVPSTVRLTGAAPLQGGPELARRSRANQLGEELQALQMERAQKYGVGA